MKAVIATKADSRGRVTSQPPKEGWWGIPELVFWD
jgi:uncharacterized GH25 family protein